MLVRSITLILLCGIILIKAEFSIKKESSDRDKYENQMRPKALENSIQTKLLSTLKKTKDSGVTRRSDFNSPLKTLEEIENIISRHNKYYKGFSQIEKVEELKNKLRKALPHPITDNKSNRFKFSENLSASRSLDISIDELAGSLAKFMKVLLLTRKERRNAEEIFEGYLDTKISKLIKHTKTTNFENYSESLTDLPYNHKNFAVAFTPHSLIDNSKGVSLMTSPKNGTEPVIINKKLSTLYFDKNIYYKLLKSYLDTLSTSDLKRMVNTELKKRSPGIKKPK